MAISVVPANEATWDDLQSIFGERGEPARCQCQYFKIPGKNWRSVPVDARAARLREETDCGNPSADRTSGLVAFLDGEPAGWCAVEPRTAYPRLATARIPWVGRSENKADPDVWSVTCFVTRVGFRRRGVGRALARAAVDFTRARGARAVEGYPMVTKPGYEDVWGELYVGTRGMFEAAGYAEVTHPFPRRVVMRVDF